MSTEKNSVIVELYDNVLTERKDDRFGRVVTTKSLNEDDLIKIAVARRTDLSETTLRASMEILRKIAIEQIANGASVKFGLAFFSLGVKGVFIGDNAKWNPSQHNLWVNTVSSSELREVIRTCSVDVRGMAQIGIAINCITDVTTGEENSRLTPGGGVNIIGSKIKIEGTDPNIGINLINLNTNEIISIPMTSILVNDPSKISFIVPASIPNGDYKLSLCTQFAPTSKNLKEARTQIFEYVLNVKTAI